MNLQELIAQATKPIDAKMVYGEPVEKDGVVVIPAARVTAGGGGGNGEDKRGQRGEGGGLGLIARPAGAFIIKDGNARWEPAVDINRVFAAVTTILVTAAIVVGRILRAKAKG
jgi:uncharacterized spore protein YtfJ